MTLGQILTALGYVKAGTGTSTRSGYDRYDADPEPVFKLKDGRRVGVVRLSTDKGMMHYHCTLAGSGAESHHATRSVPVAEFAAVVAGGAL